MIGGGGGSICKKHQVDLRFPPFSRKHHHCHRVPDSLQIPPPSVQRVAQHHHYRKGGACLPCLCLKMDGQAAGTVGKRWMARVPGKRGILCPAAASVCSLLLLLLGLVASLVICTRTGGGCSSRSRPMCVVSVLCPVVCLPGPQAPADLIESRLNIHPTQV